jgi:hypothetical protein
MCWKLTPSFYASVVTGFSFPDGLRALISEDKKWWKPFCGLIFLELRKVRLDPSAGGLAGRRVKATGTGRNALGSDTTG